VTLATLITFAAACAILMLIPGPNVGLIVANSVANGPRAGLITVAGTFTAMVAQLSVTAFGLISLLATFSATFVYLRWAGVTYLLYLGVRTWRASAEPLAGPAPAGTRTFARGFFISLANPKTIAFYSAFFPQFISAGAPAGPQFALLAGTFLAMAALIDSGWALAATRVRPLLVRRARLRNRIGGGMLIASGAGLAARQL
jgi:threonine/homoserine/homoserine lactone efflux protein